MDKYTLIQRIHQLKKEKGAVILAHHYQVEEVKEVADIIGDSLELSRKAREVKAKTIVLSGVHFMAESVKVLSPDKKVLLPVRDAGCPMADMIDEEKLESFKSEHPNGKVVCYVNTSAEVKAKSDICCTSSNALSVVDSMGADPVLFIPDQNLGNYVKQHSKNNNVIPYEGYCITHHRARKEDAIKAKGKHPEGKFLAHPECRQEVLEEADFIGSTTAIINYAKDSNSKTFIIGTEMGVVESLKKQLPNKNFFLLAPSFICSNMKKTRLKDVYRALKEEEHEIHLEEQTRNKAEKALSNMLAVSINSPKSL
ncbi:quinolinate synthase NadA [Isachenkonia alkalipeptolytica]|uniref:Quinolinate synthase n=1 Tax=Isachenkonia alkalipeptolytica TaxID=2565777 RepID=A0AA43XHX3_9CLOT|nr:quinolinate synthase NadA [Isachenkonia alkalipeptolytica]NBG87158.1 quinolinate synthase NadA [Isachenkonia alkalipeptolytica]